MILKFIYEVDYQIMIIFLKNEQQPICPSLVASISVS